MKCVLGAFMGLFAAFLSTAAMACPVSSDAQTGIMFTLKNGGKEWHRKNGDMATRVAVLFEQNDGSGSVMDFAHGVYAIRSVPVVNRAPQTAQAEVFAHVLQLATWQAPKPNLSWTIEGKGGGTVKTAPLKSVSFGPCTYEAYDLTLSYEGENYVETYRVLTALDGLALLVHTNLDGEEIKYDYVAVETSQMPEWALNITE